MTVQFDPDRADYKFPLFLRKMAMKVHYVGVRDGFNIGEEFDRVKCVAEYSGIAINYALRVHRGVWKVYFHLETGKAEQYIIVYLYDDCDLSIQQSKTLIRRAELEGYRCSFGYIRHEQYYEVIDNWHQADLEQQERVARSGHHHMIPSQPKTPFRR